MSENADTNNSSGDAKILAGYLASALDMEERINNSIYKEYMDRDKWPRRLQPDVFETIKQFLNILIEDTQRHRKLIAVLIEKYARDRQAQ